MSQPTKGRGWLFRAKHASNSFCFAFENDRGKHQHLSTLSSCQGPQTDTDQSSREIGGDTKRPAPPGSSPDKKRVHLHKDVGDRSETNFQGYEFADAGGNGDCGYRALAVAYAIQNSRDVDTAIQAGRPTGATLRAQITSHISKYRHFESVFAIDPRWTIELEGGPVPTTYAEWVESTATPNRWIDGPCLSTAATKLRRNIAIWKWETDQWVKQTVITPLAAHPQSVEDATKNPPLPLFLKNGHYVTLKPGMTPFPMSWHSCPHDSKWDAGTARGGGKSYRSWLPPSSPITKSFRSWLPPSQMLVPKEDKRQSTKEDKRQT